MIRGVDLGWNQEDPITDTKYNVIQQLLPTLQALNVNTIRVYNIKLSDSHMKVMNLLKANGIYVQIGLEDPNVPGRYINRDDPKYSNTIRQQVRNVALKFSKYDNVLAFSAGNEVNNPTEFLALCNDDISCANSKSMANAAILKALMRDVKTYQSEKGLRAIPVGLALRDTLTATLPSGLIGTDIMAQYYACASQPGDVQAGYVGVNAYRYVAGGIPTIYEELITQYGINNYNIPAWLTEADGLKAGQSRDFKDIPETYTDTKISTYLSGQMVFQLLNNNGGGGLYSNQPPFKPLSEAARNLVTKFNDVAKLDPLPIPTPPAVAIACPNNFNPLVPSAPVSGNITFYNVADRVVNVVQDGDVLTSIPAGSDDNPQDATVSISIGSTVLIQEQGTNYSVCEITKPKSGTNYNDRLSWGTGQPCPEGT
jgi:hypothetical protein